MNRECGGKNTPSPPKCADHSGVCIVWTETLGIRGQMVVEDRVRRGKQNVVIGWVNALMTRLDGHS